MARMDRQEIGLNGRLDELEQRMFILKINYEKYFTGLERIEPLREREDLRRVVRAFQEEVINNVTLRFRFQTLKARFQSHELYWTRNLMQIERGTHPKMKFRADVKSAQRAALAAAGASPPAEALSPEQQAVLQRRQDQFEREDRAYRVVFEKYMEARAQCGQTTELSYDAMRDTLRNQTRQIKSNFQCESVRFRVVVEEGKARVKAVPVTGAQPG
jgi:hypothetical protein